MHIKTYSLAGLDSSYSFARDVELNVLGFGIMASSRRMPQGIEPWWLADATETCPACSQAYAYHTEIRCVDCDGPLCPICVQVTTRLELSCPDCFECGDSESGVSK